jgi:hypothetical protein
VVLQPDTWTLGIAVFVDGGANMITDKTFDWLEG